MKYQSGWAFPDADDFMIHEIKEDGSYQRSHLELALTCVNDWSLAIDGGAHVGTWSRLMSPRFATVIAVEPSADTYEALLANLEAFGCANVEPRRVALGAGAGTATMVLEGRGKEMKNTGARYVHEGQGADSVPLVTIDSWHLETLGFLKLDIEGSEVAALEGAQKTLLRCRPIVLFENKLLWKRFGKPREAPQVFLQSLGYRHLIKAGCDEIWGPA